MSDSTRKSAHTHLSCALLLRSVCSVVWAQVALKIVRNHQQATHAHPHILYRHSHVWQGQKLDRVSETCTALERKLHGYCLAGFLWRQHQPWNVFLVHLAARSISVRVREWHQNGWEETECGIQKINKTHWSGCAVWWIFPARTPSIRKFVADAVGAYVVTRTRSAFYGGGPIVARGVEKTHPSWPTAEELRQNLDGHARAVIPASPRPGGRAK